MPCAPNRIPPDGTQRPLHPRSLRQHVALVRPRARRHSLPRRERTRRRRPRRLVYDTRPCPSGSRLPLRSRRSFAARISISTATAGSRRAGAIARREHRRDPARSGRSRPNIVRRRLRSRRSSSASPASARPSSPTASSGARARPHSGKAGRTIGGELESLVDAGSYASLARCTQYAHFTPEYIVRAVWTAVMRLGFRGGRVLEPGIGSGLFPALMPASAARLLPRHRRRTRSGDRPDRETLAAACEDPQR